MTSEKIKSYTHVFLDLDNTLTENKSKITKKMRALLDSLPHDIVVVSGATIERMHSQLDGFECFMLGQNGNHAMFGEDELWKDDLKPDKVVEIMDHITSLPRTWDVPDEHDLLFNMGCQIAFSLYGFNAPKKEKDAFDPKQALRKKLLRDYPLISDTVEVTISGSTSLDYTRKGRHKGYNVARLIEYLGWEKNACLYIGDALYEQGNDFSVIGVIDTISVSEPKEAYTLLKKLPHAS